MHETPSDAAVLQDLLDQSMAEAGNHFSSIITPERRLCAREICDRLTGMSLLALATVTSDGKPLVGPVDGVFYRGSFYFGSSPESARFRHIRRQPYVSATPLPGEDFAVTVHGQAVPVDVRSRQHAGFRDVLLGVYVPRYGSEWETFLDSGPVYARIDASKMFVFHMAVNS